MGQGQSNLSSSEESQEESENNSLEEKSRQKISYRRGGKIRTKSHDPLVTTNHVRNPSKPNGANGKITHEEEKNYSERIIREKEKLLKEQEETIRQQAQLIKTQNELLEQRKLIPNVGASKVHYDLIFKPHVPPTAECSRFLDSTESVQIRSHDQRNSNQGTTGNDFEKKYNFDRNNVVDPKLQKRQDQTFSMRSPTFTNGKHSAFDFSFHNSLHSSTSTPQYKPIYHSSQTSNFNASTPNLNKLGTLPTPIMQSRKCQNNEYRRNNNRKDEQREDDTEQSTRNLLEDIEKQTIFELHKLNNVQSSYSSNNNIDMKKNANDRKLKQGKSIQGNFKCPGCSASWKSKIAFIGASQKCRRCGNDVGSKIMDKNSKSENEDRSQNTLISKTEEIADVDD